MLKLLTLLHSLLKLLTHCLPLLTSAHPCLVTFFLSLLRANNAVADSAIPLCHFRQL
jgi:hypothetical protein